ncbi:MAG: type II toxin-antitoxin system PemK/MazF family toxin [Deltaproteobacteria bacterium]|nr:type II toxin-antitoxin system PemK/MazF family toxin [Deltaproteobacteria bacterium]
MRRGEVRLFGFPPPDKERPVVVLTRSSALRFLNRVTVAPVTSTVRDIPTEVVLDEDDGMRGRCAVNLDHVVTVPRQGLGRRLTALRADKLAAICRALDFALGCDAA